MNDRFYLPVYRASSHFNSQENQPAAVKGRKGQRLIIPKLRLIIATRLISLQYPCGLPRRQFDDTNRPTTSAGALPVIMRAILATIKRISQTVLLIPKRSEAKTVLAIST